MTLTEAEVEKTKTEKSAAEVFIDATYAVAARRRESLQATEPRQEPLHWWPDSVRVEGRYSSGGRTFVMAADLVGEFKVDERRISLLKRALWDIGEWARLIDEGVDVPDDVRACVKDAEVLRQAAEPAIRSSA